MSEDPASSPTPLQIAQRLVAHETAQVRDSEPTEVGAALERACLRVSENIRDSLGEAGWTALLARALARTAPDHPALQDIRRPGAGAVDMCGVVAGVDVHGLAAVTAAIEALIAAFIEIIGRLIGEDMAIRLIEHDSPKSRRDGGEQVS